MNKKYVILNAAQETESKLGKAMQFLYRAASFLGHSKLRHAPIINIVNEKPFDELTQKEKDAIKDADKIIILGHCVKGSADLTDNRNRTVSPFYLADFLNNANPKKQAKQISVVACESTEFGRELATQCSHQDNLKSVTITARTFVTQPDPFTGKKYNFPEKNKKVHQGEEYKTKFTVNDREYKEELISKIKPR